MIFNLVPLNFIMNANEMDTTLLVLPIEKFSKSVAFVKQTACRVFDPGQPSKRLSLENKKLDTISSS